MGFDIILILFALVVIVLLPLVILFGLMGIAFQGISFAFVFVLKYLLPGTFIGLIGTFVYSRLENDYFELEEYAKGAAIGTALFFVLFLVWLRLIPVHLDAPKLDEVASISVYYSYDKEEKAETFDSYMIEKIVDSVYSLDYHRTVEEIIDVDEEDGSPIYAEMFDAEGKSLGKLAVYSAKCLKIGNQWYEPKKDNYLNRDVIADVIHKANEKAVKENWMPFVKELFDSVAYDADLGEIVFTIPDEIPVIEKSYYSITLDLIGMLDCSDRSQYQAHKYEIYTDEQKNDTWEVNTTYALQQINTSLWEKIHITFNAPYINEVYDCLTLLPEELIQR